MPRISVNIVTGAPGMDDGEIITLDVPPGLSIQDLKALIQVDIGVEPSSQHLFVNNRSIRDDQQTIEAAGINDGDMVAVVCRDTQQQQQQQQRETREAGQRRNIPVDAQSIEQNRQRMLRDPAILTQVQAQQPRLHESINDPDRFRQTWLEMVQHDQQRERARQDELAMLNNDPMDIDSQRKIEEMIRQDQVMQNLEFAYLHSPEVFGRVTMLYVPVTVNNYPVKAFVDSGAQTTIMSPSCAEACGIMRLIDKRYSGIAKGVGTAQILGRVHAADITIGVSSMSCSFTVMEGKDVDLLLGLDMLKRFQAIIDLKQNKLIFGDGNDVSFLGESEIPKYMDDAQQSEPTVPGPDGTEIGAKSGTIKPAGTSAAAASSNTGSGAFQSKSNTLGGPDTSSNAAAATSSLPARPSQSSQTSQPKHSAEKVQQLTTLGFTMEQAIQALDACDGNVEVAASFLFGI